MGKTALALNIAQHAAKTGQKTVAVFSLEMSKEALLTRLLCAGARVDSHRFRLGYLDAEERRRLQAAASELVEAPLYIDDTSGSNLMEHARQAAAAQGRAAPGPGGARLPPVDERPRAVRQPGAGDQRAVPRPEAAGQGAERADAGPVAVEPRAGDAARATTARSSATCASRAPSSRTPTWWRSSSARKSTSPTARTCAGQAELLLSKQRNGPTGKITAGLPAPPDEVREPRLRPGRRRAGGRGVSES